MLLTLVVGLALAQELPIDTWAGNTRQRELLAGRSADDAYAAWLAAVDGMSRPDGALKKDTDGDGIRDGWDLCIQLPEDRARGREQDGCPEGASGEAYRIDAPPKVFAPIRGGDAITRRDPDYDEVAGAADLCPREPEDHDGFADDDGCPDVDNDADGFLDGEDACRDEAGPDHGCPADLLSSQTAPDPSQTAPDPARGAPPADEDGDGIGDARDRCIAEAEIVNGYEDDDGCPDESPAAAASAGHWTDALFGGAPAGLRPTETPPASTAPPPVPASPLVAGPAPVAAPAAKATARTTLPSVDGRLVGTVRAPGDSAVVIGLEDYLVVSDVPYARRDAGAVYAHLLYTRGIPAHRIRLLEEGSREHILKAVEEAGREAGPGDTVWVYFAGHGAASPTTRERLLLGDDVRADPTGFEARAVPVAEVERLARAGGARAVLMIDACFSGRGRGGEELAGGTRFAVPAYVSAGAGVAQWSAAGPNELSGPLEGVEHGAFTYWAVGALRGWADGELDGARDGRVTAAEADAYVSRALRAHGVRDQRPVWTADGDAEEWVLAEGVSEVGPAF